MVTSAQCLKKYGEPSKTNPFLTWWDVPPEFEVNQIPKKLWCNKDLVGPLSKAFRNLLDRGFMSELCTWDGCFNIRNVRGGDDWSLHSWAIAIDVNAFENGLGQPPRLSQGFVKCFTDAGFDWGGNFKRKDGMHFQLAKI